MNNMLTLISRRKAMAVAINGKASDIGIFYRLIFFGFHGFFIFLINYFTLPRTNTDYVKTIDSFWNDENFEKIFFNILSFLVILLVARLAINLKKVDPIRYFLMLFIPISLQSFIVSILFMLPVLLSLSFIWGRDWLVCGGYLIILFYNIYFFINYYICFKKVTQSDL